MKTIIYGHKNPDTDTICSAIAYSELKNLLNDNTEPRRLGELNEETKFVLEYFDVKKPELIDNISGLNVILVDHNERSQSADGFEQAKVLEVIDHHRVANFNVSDPLKMRLEPYGCTATIIFDMYKENNLLPSKKIAGLMLSAIISDTLLLKSPTCTEKDIIAAKELSNLAEVELENYGLKMLKAGTNLSTKTETELLNMDMKVFVENNVRFAVAQVNTVSEDEVLSRKEKLYNEIKSIIEKENLETFIFVITNILTNDSLALVYGRVDFIEEAFNQKVSEDKIILKGVVSRKKQIIPPISNILNK